MANLHSNISAMFILPDFRRVALRTLFVCAGKPARSDERVKMANRTQVCGRLFVFITLYFSLKTSITTSNNNDLVINITPCLPFGFLEVLGEGGGQ